ncbi:YdcF family protein [Alteraurantiacibacter buctensis]|uniref:YdcF family protein n=1 Tax=Alteraurantiacibacter buctensis TaxID=1503981 RepID=A0A844YW48_9SPHN|nr:YdcF family protein [Alteraurantiacibacter buctensis]MXO70297.1 YdcF family protein [Alteraurantiacibacter buctensis]
MINRLLSLLVIAWALGFVWFAVALPQPAGDEHTDAIVVPTGAEGRIPHGLALLRAGRAERMLVTGVDIEVRPAEFMAEYGVERQLMDCCITLGFSALDTRGNARETADWMAQNRFTSLRLVTSDWHMRRTAVELASRLPATVTVLRDAVPTQPSFITLVREYHKLLAAWLLSLV